jgi:hypothetical protein
MTFKLMPCSFHYSLRHLCLNLHHEAKLSGFQSSCHNITFRINKHNETPT